VALTPRLRDFLLRYAYPGNIRELRNIMYRISCLAGETADLSHLPEDIRPAPRSAGAAQRLRRRTACRWPRPSAPPATRPNAICLERGLQEVGGTVAELARRWDMNRSHLQILLKKHGLHSKDFRKDQ
jgi:DNA-binding NtrC family response regulator